MKKHFLIALGLLIGQAGFAQEKSKASLEDQVSKMAKEIEAMQHDFDQVTKGIDDLNWYNKLSDVAFVDKVIITGPPPAIVKNPTGQGAKNPVRFSAYVFIPSNIDINKKYPLLVLPHGGVHSNFTSTYAHIIRELIAQEYVVVAADYRGSTGYGAGFYKQIDYGGLEWEM